MKNKVKFSKIDLNMYFLVLMPEITYPNKAISINDDVIISKSTKNNFEIIAVKIEK